MLSRMGESLRHTSSFRHAVLLILMLMTGGISAWASFDYDYNGLRYRLYNESGEQWAEVIAPKTGTYTGDIVIDGVVVYEPTSSYEVVKDKNFPVKAIATGAFKGASGLTSVTIPEGLDSLGARVFYSCRALTSVVLPSSVRSLGQATFYNCQGLASVTLSSSLTAIADSTFMRCTALQSVSVPASVTTIGDDAFRGCTSLRTVRLSEGLINLGRSANYTYVFEECTSLSSISIPKSVKLIGGAAFKNCTALAEVSLPSLAEDQVQGFDLFEGCTALQWITLPEGWNLKGSMFSGCTNLEQVRLPKSTTTIGTRCFYGCKSLLEIDIPAGVSHIWDYAFANCKSLTQVVIPQGVQNIGDHAFGGCESLSQVEIPGSVQTIGEVAFSGCTALERIVIPEGVQSIGKRAFNLCAGIQAMVIPETVTFLGEQSLPPNVTHVLSLANLSEAYKSDHDPFNSTCVVYVPNGKKSCYNRSSSLLKAVFPTENTPTSITLTATDDYTFTKAALKYSSDTLSARSADSGGNVCFDGLIPGTRYNFDVEGFFHGLPFATHIDDKLYGGYGQWTEYLDYTFTLLTQTNTTLRVKAVCTSNVDIEKYALTVNGVTYDGKNEALVTGLFPEETIKCTFAVTLKGGHTCTSADRFFSTKPVDMTVSTAATASSLALTGTYSVIDADVTTSEIDQTGQSAYKWTGLEPNTSYTHQYQVTVRVGAKTRKYSKSVPVKLPALEIETLQPKGLTATSTLVAGRANVDDEETGAGFQWRKYDAPSTLKSSEAYAPVYGGTIEGYIKNLSTASYYNVRAFYKSASGTYYYGEWVTFDPSDFSYFEPTVHTYALVQVVQGTAHVGGVVLQGSSEIVEQGFEYWASTAARSAHVKTVQASGQRMEADLTGLASKTTYSVRAYARTAEGTTYGETIQFTTPVLTAIDAVTAPDGNGLSLRVKQESGLQIAVNGSQSTDCTYRLLTADGGLVATGTAVGDGTWQTLTTQRLRPGLYVVSVDDGHHRRTKKVFVR